MTIACSHCILSFLLLFYSFTLVYFASLHIKSLHATYLIDSLFCSPRVIHHRILSFIYLDSSSPLFLPVFFTTSHFSLQYCLSTLCTSYKDFSNSCHHPSLAAREDSVCVEICRSTVGGGCVCTDRHWVNVIKG